MGYYSEVVLDDKNCRNRENLAYCKENKHTFEITATRWHQLVFAQFDIGILLRDDDAHLVAG